MFTLQQISEAHSKVKTGADFPRYIQEIKSKGVISFETWVSDSHTEYFGRNNYRIISPSQYSELSIAESSQKDLFIHFLKKHQQGETDFHTFCGHCAEAGIERWVVDLEQYTCTYYDSLGVEILVESVPEL